MNASLAWNWLTFDVIGKETYLKSRILISYVRKAKFGVMLLLVAPEFLFLFHRATRH